MQAVTSEAASAGVPLLALHAAHPALYARFGFAPAIRSASVEVDCARFALAKRPAGTVHEADPRQADELGRTVAASAGADQLRGPGDHAARPTGEPTGRRRPPGGASCTSTATATIDGVLTYVFQGWTPQAQVLEVLSETYSTIDGPRGALADGRVHRDRQHGASQATCARRSAAMDDPGPGGVAGRRG